MKQDTKNAILKVLKFFGKAILVAVLGAAMSKIDGKGDSGKPDITNQQPTMPDLSQPPSMGETQL